MLDRIGTLRGLFLLGLLAVVGGGGRALAQDALWHVGKSSGEVWLTGSGVQTVALTGEAVLKPGDSIRTGRSGRVLLVRGEETILISPNSIIGIPMEPKDGLSTTIIQQAGSILLEVEKRNVKHFEVETPYFAAVVKGTQFRVSIDKSDASVDVLRGLVEVADFKSGQLALVLPGQIAKVLARGLGGLSLSGSGSFNPIQQGQPRPSSVQAVPVPKEGFSAPADVVPKGPQLHMASATSAQPLAGSFGGAGGPSPSDAGASIFKQDPIHKGDASTDGRPIPTSGPKSDASTDGRPVPKGSPVGAADGRLAIQDGLTAADGRSPGFSVRMASAASQAGSLIGSSEGSSAQSDGWSVDLMAWGKAFFGRTEHRSNGKEDITFDLLFCSAVGGGVALMVSIGRLWRRRSRAAA
jgi:hypothetical protein